MSFLTRFALVTVSAAASLAAFAPAARADSPRYRVRISHARELMGKYYSNSVVKEGEDVKRVDRFVRRETRAKLPASWRNRTDVVADAILHESQRHGFDPIFLMAVIENESRFNPSTRGGAGEIGLMQVLPPTGKWIAGMTGYRWKGARTLRDPVQNIRFGAAYLAWLRDQFDSHARLYLAAYNMGQGNVGHALSRDIWPRDYASKVMNYYLSYYGELKNQAHASSRKVAARSIASETVPGFATAPSELPSGGLFLPSVAYEIPVMAATCEGEE